jgi:hypothetical protein
VNTVAHVSEEWQPQGSCIGMVGWETSGFRLILNERESYRLHLL